MCSCVLEASPKGRWKTPEPSLERPPGGHTGVGLRLRPASLFSENQPQTFTHGGGIDH